MSVSEETLSSTLTVSTEALRMVTVQRDGIHPVLKAVRTAYRAQRRKPQFEPVFVEWIHRFLRLFPDEPVGRIALLHVDTFLRKMGAEGKLTHGQKIQAREALNFLRSDVLDFGYEA